MVVCGCILDTVIYGHKLLAWVGEVYTVTLSRLHSKQGWNCAMANMVNNILLLPLQQVLLTYKQNAMVLWVWRSPPFQPQMCKVRGWANLNCTETQLPATADNLLEQGIGTMLITRDKARFWVLQAAGPSQLFVILCPHHCGISPRNSVIVMNYIIMNYLGVSARACIPDS